MITWSSISCNVKNHYNWQQFVENDASSQTLCFSCKYFRCRMRHVMPRSQSLCFSTCWDSTLSRACFVRTSLPSRSWLATARAWWMCPSIGAVKGTKGNADAGAASLLSTVLSLVISKYQTHAGSSGNLLELDIQPGRVLHVSVHLNCLGNSHLLNVHRYPYTHWALYLHLWTYCFMHLPNRPNHAAGDQCIKSCSYILAASSVHVNQQNGENVIFRVARLSVPDSLV